QCSHKCELDGRLNALLQRSRMFIDTQANPKNRAPEERNVVSDDSHQQHFAPPELRKLYALAYYKHFVPPGLLPIVRNLPGLQSLGSQSMRPTAHRNRLTIRILCLLCLLCFGGKLALALDPTRDLSQFNAQVWLTENGLPQNTVHSIAQARDGYVWIANEEGLARFDGI